MHLCVCRICDAYEIGGGELICAAVDQGRCKGTVLVWLSGSVGLAAGYHVRCCVAVEVFPWPPFPIAPLGGDVAIAVPLEAHVVLVARNTERQGIHL